MHGFIFRWRQFPHNDILAEKEDKEIGMPQ